MKIIPWRHIADDTFKAHSDDWGPAAAELQTRIKPRTFHLEDDGTYTTPDGHTIPSVRPVADPTTYDLTNVDDVPPQPDAGTGQ